MTDSDQVGEWFAALLAASEEHGTALHDAYQQLENADLIRRVVVHRYICRKQGCRLAVVVAIGDRLIARTSGYKLAPGTNAATSVPRARSNNTLDGHRHWPGHTFDVSDLATWGDRAGITMNCRHGLRTVLAAEIASLAVGVPPGHPRAPSRI